MEKLEPHKPIKRRWLKMGVELEGAWDEPYQDVASKVRGAQGKHDGSVGDGERLAGAYPGEITTRPHDTLDDLLADLTPLWPPYVNRTCGFHIHTSFTDLDTSALTEKSFWKFFQERWDTWGKAHEAEMSKDEIKWFWDRFESKSEKARRYCKSEFKPEQQLTNHEDRYTAINFCSYSKYKTVEVRFLPMFKSAELAKKAVRELSAIFDDYLANYSFPEISLETESVMAGDWVIENYNSPMPIREFFEENPPCKPVKKLPTGPDILYHFRGITPVFSKEDSEDLQEP